MSGPEDNPADDQPIDRDEWEAWEKEHAKERTFACGHTPEDCDCDPTPEQEERAAIEESFWDGRGLRS